jgi:hypothetical protein
MISGNPKYGTFLVWVISAVQYPSAQFLNSPETMVAFLKEFRNKYGTAENYIKTKTPLTDQDIAQIRDNLLVPKT